MSLKIDITAQFERLKSSLFCKCGTPKTQRFSCGHNFCSVCEANSKTTTSCVVCKETQLVEDDGDLNESKKYVLGVFQKITDALCAPNKSNVSDRNFGGSPNKIGDYEVLLSTPFKCNRKGESPLHVACKVRNLAALQKHICEGHSLNCKDYAGWTPLHEAVESDFYEGVRLLLEASALCDVPGDSYTTPLHKAVVRSTTTSNYATVELLKNFGADVNACDYSGNTPLNLGDNRVKELLLRDATTVQKSPKKVYIERVVVCYKKIKPQQKRELLKTAEFGVSVTDQTTHLVVDDGCNRTELLMGVLLGVFITDVKWLDDFIGVNGSKLVPNSGYFGESEHNRKSVLNRLLGRPKLFDGVNFYVQGPHKELVVDGATFTKADLISLIKAGGGRLLSRSPTPTTATQPFVPYHSPDKHTLMRVCYNYVIYDATHPPELQYNMPEIKHKPSEWLIACVNNFKLE